MLPLDRPGSRLSSIDVRQTARYWSAGSRATKREGGLAAPVSAVSDFAVVDVHDASIATIARKASSRNIRARSLHRRELARSVSSEFEHSCAPHVAHVDRTLIGRHGIRIGEHFLHTRRLHLHDGSAWILRKSTARETAASLIIDAEELHRATLRLSSRRLSSEWRLRVISGRSASTLVAANVIGGRDSRVTSGNFSLASWEQQSFTTRSSETTVCA